MTSTPHDPSLTPTHAFHGAAATVDASRMMVAQFTAAEQVPTYTVEKLANGNTMVRGLKVFRAGTFKDSKGRKNTWTGDQLGLMKSNFEALRDAGVLVDVPWRTDHTGSVKDIAGYVRAVNTDGRFLYSDLEFTEPDAFDKFQRGTFNARSAEVGFYESNDEDLYWPVLCGVAFVDIGAVEGLYERQDLNNFNLLTDTKDTNVTEAEFLAACAYAQAVIDLGLTDTVSQADHQAAVVTARAEATAAAAAQHGAGNPVTFTFRVAGADTTDFGAVQLHITALETAQDEARSQSRQDFVKSLVTANKIAATMVDGLQSTVADMSDDAFAAFQKVYEAAPANALFVTHGGSPANPGGEAGEIDELIAIAKETVAMHKRGGMSDEQIQHTKSFKDLEALEAQRKAA